MLKIEGYFYAGINTCSVTRVYFFQGTWMLSIHPIRFVKPWINYSFIIAPLCQGNARLIKSYPGEYVA